MNFYLWQKYLHWLLTFCLGYDLNMINQHGHTNLIVASNTCTVLDLSKLTFCMTSSTALMNSDLFPITCKKFNNCNNKHYLTMQKHIELQNRGYFVCGVKLLISHIILLQGRINCTCMHSYKRLKPCVYLECLWRYLDNPFLTLVPWTIVTIQVFSKGSFGRKMKRLRTYHKIQIHFAFR